MLEVRGLHKSFGGFEAIAGVGLRVERGQIFAIIGPNGAGKSTLFNLITGHLRPTSGTVALEGRDVTGIAPHRLCALGVGRSFQRSNIFPRLTVLEPVPGQPGVSRVIASNDDWCVGQDRATIAAAAAQVYAFGLEPYSRDACLLLSLEPGSYTVHLAGAPGSSGVALVEVYALP